MGPIVILTYFNLCSIIINNGFCICVNMIVIAFHLFSIFYILLKMWIRFQMYKFCHFKFCHGCYAFIVLNWVLESWMKIVWWRTKCQTCHASQILYTLKIKFVRSFVPCWQNWATEDWDGGACGRNVCSRFPKEVLDGKLAGERRPHGRLELRYKDIC